MDDRQIYAYYPVFRATEALREMDPAARDAAIHEVELLLKEWSGPSASACAACIRPSGSARTRI